MDSYDSINDYKLIIYTIKEKYWNLGKVQNLAWD